MSATDDLTLSASILDPEVSSTAGQGVTITWSCQNYTNSNYPCYNQNGKVLTFNSTNTENFAANTLIPGQNYIFSVQGAKDTRTCSYGQLVTVAAGAVQSVGLSFTAYSVNGTSNLND